MAVGENAVQHLKGREPLVVNTDEWPWFQSGEPNRLAILSNCDYCSRRQRAFPIATVTVSLPHSVSEAVVTVRIGRILQVPHLTIKDLKVLVRGGIRRASHSIFTDLRETQSAKVAWSMGARLCRFLRLRLGQPDRGFF